MAKQNLVLSNTVGGELSPLMGGRLDIPVYQKGLSRCENWRCLPQGGADFRNGTIFVKHTHNNLRAVFVPFQFSDSQSYLIEFVNGVISFYRNNGVVIKSSRTFNISNVTIANPGVITTSAAHGLVVGEEVFLTGIGGTTDLNGRYLYVNSVPTTTTFTLRDVFGNVISTLGMSAFTGGGTETPVYKVVSQYADSHLDDLKFAQTADTMWITHPSFRPATLTRTADDTWVFDNAPNLQGAGAVGLLGSSAEYPRAVAFTPDSRLMLGGTTANPAGVWGSKTPDQASGTPRFTNFGAAAIPLASDGYAYTQASVNGKVDVIQWICSTPKFIVLGCSGTVRRFYGTTEEQAPSPLGVSAKPVNTFGADRANPAPVGASLFYIERGSQRIRNLDYDYEIDAYDTSDMNLASDHISYDMKQIAFQNANPDTLWGRRLDGRLVGLTYKSRENIAGWHRHYLGGSHVDSSGTTQPYGKVINIGIMGRATAGEQLWIVAERLINGVTARTVEYMADKPRYPIKADFYTGDKTTDETKYRDAKYEVQKTALHMDCAALYDGTNSSVNLTLSSAAVGTGITVSASAAVFSAAMVGRQIWKKYDSRGNGGGRATITGFTSSTQITVQVTSAFNSVSLPASSWMLTATQISGLYHLEGQTVGVVADGGPVGNKVVSQGKITLDAPASVVWVGLKYVGLIATLNLDFGGQSGSAQVKPRQINEVWFKFLNSLGLKCGMDLYDLKAVLFEKGIMDRPQPLTDSFVKQRTADSRLSREKILYIMQDQPLPSTILSIDLYGDTTDED